MGNFSAGRSSSCPAERPNRSKLTLQIFVAAERAGKLNELRCEMERCISWRNPFAPRLLISALRVSALSRRLSRINSANA
jgi:hypothetical protein